MKKTALGLLLAVGLVLGVGGAGSALISPITTVAPTCTSLKVSLAYYYQPRAARLNNRVIVNIDGITTSTDFGAFYSDTYAWDPTRSHKYTVTVDGNRIMGSALINDTVVSGTQLPCG